MAAKKTATTKKATAKNAPEAKATTKKKATATKAATPKKSTEKKAAPAKKATAKKPAKEPKVKAVFQYQELEFTESSCVKKAQAGFKKSHKGVELKDISIYIKPDIV